MPYKYPLDDTLTCLLNQKVSGFLFRAFSVSFDSVKQLAPSTRIIVNHFFRYYCRRFCQMLHPAALGPADRRRSHTPAGAGGDLEPSTSRTGLEGAGGGGHPISLVDRLNTMSRVRRRKLEAEELAAEARLAMADPLMPITPEIGPVGYQLAEGEECSMLEPRVKVGETISLSYSPSRDSLWLTSGSAKFIQNPVVGPLAVQW